MKYHLIIHPDLKQDMDRLYQAFKQDQNSPQGREFQAAVDALKALREGRESEYQGKQLGYGPGSHDLRDAAELKVPVVQEYSDHGRPLGPSHRLVYREFEPLPTVENGQVVRDPNARAYREALNFTARSDDPAAVAGQRLGRDRGMPQPELQGIAGGGRPDVGPQRPGVQTTPHRVPVPKDLLRQAAILRDSPPAGTAPKPSSAPAANVNRPATPSRTQDRNLDS